MAPSLASSSSFFSLSLCIACKCLPATYMHTAHLPSETPSPHGDADGQFPRPLLITGFPYKSRGACIACHSAPRTPSIHPSPALSLSHTHVVTELSEYTYTHTGEERGTCTDAYKNTERGELASQPWLASPTDTLPPGP